MEKATRCGSFFRLHSSESAARSVFRMDHLADTLLDRVVGDDGAVVFPPEFGEDTDEGIGSLVEHV